MGTFVGLDGNKLPSYGDGRLDNVLGLMAGQPTAAVQTISDLTSTPEPSTLVLLGVGAIGLLGLRMGRRRRAE